MIALKRVTSIFAGAIFAGSILTGCVGVAANADSEGRDASAPTPSIAQEEALADGAVDRAEYEAAFAAFQACMAEGGYPVEVLDANSTLIDYRYLAEADDVGIADPCYRSEFVLVDDSWQLAHQDERADGALLDACLEENGLTVPKTRQAKVDELIEAGVDLGSCLDD
ncbi:hypothetical protein NVV95_08415 [Herbiconiux sp. CPCC 205716]|uniref:Lipoprotein n=1 Tax=Herbiconiux gentiana TaxID=2970912 RepID=A0ABT2GEE5_9MICO|nr:hypothetical protein [Herbiconiux gentiana]MCS5714575.1 hypothetical protein [Herbiconiux gentiana]